MRVIPSAPNEMQLLDHRPPLPERTSPPGRKKERPRTRSSCRMTPIRSPSSISTGTSLSSEGGLSPPQLCADYSFSVNQVESDFIPFRSTLAPSHTANAIGMDSPDLNCVSLASPFSSVRFTTTRHVGPE